MVPPATPGGTGRVLVQWPASLHIRIYGRWIIQTLDGTPDRNQSQDFGASRVGGDVVSTDIDFRLLKKCSTDIPKKIVWWEHYAEILFRVFFNMCECITI